MQGIEEARLFYELAVKPMIESDFSDVSDRIAIGLVGHGSECFLFDDEVSRDHDFEPSLCIWLDDEAEREFGFRLMRAYTKVQKDYSASHCITEKSLGAKDFRGVMTISNFYSKYTGRAGAPESLEDWVYIPSSYLAEATNGEVFCDPLGRFTEIRDRIKNGMPSDARLKRLASCTFCMAQSGQYNFKRCLEHGETVAARLALAEFVKNAIEAVFLLNRAHAPYYKWSFRAMKELRIMGDSAEILEKVINMSCEDHIDTEREIENFCSCVIAELRCQGLTDSCSDYLEGHAYSINGRIKNAGLRNAHIVI